MMIAAPALLAPFGWRALWLANAALVALYALAFARATAALPTPGASPEPFATGVAATLRAPGPRLLALTFATYTFQYLAVFGLLPTLLIETAGASPATAAALAALAIALNAPGNVIAGWLLQSGAPRWALIAGASVGMAALALPLYVGDLAMPWRVAAAAALSLVAAGLPSSVLGAAPALAPSPRHIALTNGVIMQGAALGQTLGPPAVAALAQATGSWAWSPAALGAAAALGVVLALRLRALERGRR